MHNYHLIPDGDRWRLIREGSDRTIGEFDTKAQAVESGTMLINERTGSLKIHLADGTIEEERTFPRAADPQQTRG